MKITESGMLWPAEVYADKGSELAHLYQVSHEMAQATGFTQLSVVNYILTGTKPLLSPYNIRIHRRTDATYHTVKMNAVIELNTPDVTDKQLRTIRKIIRQDWEVENTKLPDEHDLQLQNIVEQFGGVPQKRGSKTVFWDKACREWNKQERQKDKQSRQLDVAYKPKLHKN